MRIGDHDIGVCSWSLNPKDSGDLVRLIKKLGLSHVQLALGPLLALDERKRADEMKLLRERGLKITAGMIGFPGEDISTIASIKQTGGYVPDEQFEARREITARAATLCRQLGLSKLSTHVGFVPTSSDEKYEV